MQRLRSGSGPGVSPGRCAVRASLDRSETAPPAVAAGYDAPPGWCPNRGCALPSLGLTFVAAAQAWPAACHGGCVWCTSLCHSPEGAACHCPRAGANCIFFLQSTTSVTSFGQSTLGLPTASRQTHRGCFHLGLRCEDKGLISINAPPYVHGGIMIRRTWVGMSP